MTEPVNPIPDGYHTITPSLTVRDCAEALEFYKDALGAVERMRAPGPEGSVWHAEIQIGDSIVMLNDEYPEQGAHGPQALGGSPVGLWLYVEDADAAFARAVEAGAEVTMPPADMFWGDRMGSVVDPYGHKWTFASKVEDVGPEEMKKRQQEAMGQAEGT
ncbi:VOC family protein [Persicimonas caeni]|uniref:VOC family protein n=1 Tax=Persicimonas caeni TaxID=2292766 RepID=A0A4Y6PQ84_PERCE|nr:VOC family protein [Persicimonas caeni]QDG50484.1 VOC family protein [Persicimonas caeni]QED31705.1 VOC family protein [Persicimonas caeni]